MYTIDSTLYNLDEELWYLRSEIQRLYVKTYIEVPEDMQAACRLVYDLRNQKRAIIKQMLESGKNTVREVLEQGAQLYYKRAYLGCDEKGFLQSMAVYNRPLTSPFQTGNFVPLTLETKVKLESVVLDDDDAYEYHVVPADEVATESMKDLDHESTEELFERLKTDESEEFTETPKLSPATMFIFPDGRMIGSYYGAKVVRSGFNKGQLDRHANHSSIYAFNPKHRDKDDSGYFGHPALDSTMARFHNIVVVSAGHEAKALLIPYGVEPTEQQEKIIQKAIKLGYSIEYGKKHLWDNLQ